MLKIEICPGLPLFSRSMKILYPILLSLGLCAALVAKEKVNVLLISGQNNHNWKVTTPLMVESLDTTGRFEVTVTNEIEKMEPASLVDFDVIVSNWNLFKFRKGIPEGLRWSKELRDAYVNIVANGKGHVAVHAGSSTFYDWSDYQEICVATWTKGTHHGPKHEFEVRIEDVVHPVTEGLKNFRKWDELWEKIYISSEDATVLTSNYASEEFKGDNVWEPSTVVSKFGKGRTAYTSLGHDDKSFKSAEFRVLLARLVEWAATGEVTIPAPSE